MRAQETGSETQWGNPKEVYHNMTKHMVKELLSARESEQPPPDDIENLLVNLRGYSCLRGEL